MIEESILDDYEFNCYV